MKICEFSIETDVLKKAVALISAVLPKGTENSGFILFEVANNIVLLTACSSGNYLRQTLNAVKIRQPGKFAVQIDSLTKIKYPGKEIIFSVAKNLVAFKSGDLIGELAFVVNNNRVETNIPKEIIELTHDFSYDSFITGLKFISFSPIQEDFKKKIVMLVIKDKKFMVSSNDSHRGARFISDMDAPDLNLTVDFTSLMSVLSSFPVDGTIKFGATQKLIRICCPSIDYQFPYCTGTVRDMEKEIKLRTRGVSPEFSFCVDTKAFKKAIDAACCVVGLSKAKEVKLNLKMKKGKEIQKSPADKDVLKISAATKVARTEYDLPIEDLLNEGIAYVPNKIFKGILLMDGYIQLSFYPQMLLLESLNCDLKFVLPRLKG